MTTAYTVCVDHVTTRGIPPCVSEMKDGAWSVRTYSEALREQPNVHITLQQVEDPYTGTIKCSVRIANRSTESVRVSRADAGIAAPNGSAQLQYFSSNWGREYDPLSMRLTETHSIQVISGRSGKGYAPWAGLVCEEGVYSMTVAWSGNWQASTHRQEEHLYAMMGIYEGDFYIDLPPGGEFQGADVCLAFSPDSMEDACLSLRRFFIEHVSILDREKCDTLPLIYNTWWCYEDRLVNEQKCRDNARIAADVGITNFLLDAGWFGNNDGGVTWFGKRGDWDIENTKDFPSGIAALGREVNATGVDFGIWCEIEAVGDHAKLNTQRPDLLARRYGRSLGYICMGNPEARSWAHGVVRKLVEDYGAKWIKFDFNLDPNMGCNCRDHGHGEGDGLYAHYMGYYTLMEELHEKYPGLVLENCCSGGLRMDFGIMSKMHMAFLSDPDYMEHHFQAYWGATSFLHPAACYHFTQSETLGDINGALQNPISADMPRERLDYYIRGGMLCVIGFSYDLPSWPQWCLERLKEHVVFYKSFSKKYILCGDMYRLTGQAIRGGQGDRWQAYQFRADDGSAKILAFRLPGADGERTIHPKGLDSQEFYSMRYEDCGRTEKRTGKDLMENGIVLSGMAPETSEIIHIG